MGKTRSLTIGIVLALVISGLGWIGSGTASAARIHTVYRDDAERASYSVLRQVSGWRYRSEGFLDCSRGRIDRITWACRYGYRQGNLCGRGRIQVRGYYDYQTYEQKISSHLSGRKYRC